MSRNQQAAQFLFAVAMIGLGLLALAYGIHGTAWYSVPAWVPWRAVVTYASGVILLASGAGLLFAPTATISSRVLFGYLAIWLCMRVPTLIDGPLVPVNWENAAELGTLTAGAWVILARLAGASVPLAARIMFGLSLVAFGIAHFAYVPQTAGLIPAIFPFHTGLVYFTGAAHCAAGLGVLFSVVPRLAARLEAAMLAIFTLAVWVPTLFAPRISLGTWTEFVVSCAVTAGAWVVAESIPANRAAL